MQVMRRREDFWVTFQGTDLHQLLRYSLFLGFFPFAGYLVNYTIRGTIWNVWPFVQTTLDVGSGLVFAGMQWIFFSMFPVLSSLILDLFSSRSKAEMDFGDAVGICTYSMTPLCLGMLFVGVPYFDRILTTLGFATFLFLLYYGCRTVLRFTMVRSFWTVFLYFFLFAGIRQMFVFAIGY
jgi:hypothetical protein